MTTRLRGSVNGQRISYHERTPFQVQVSNSLRGKYVQKTTIFGDLKDAIEAFNAIAIGSGSVFGCKKRLVMGTRRGVKVLLREIA